MTIEVMGSGCPNCKQLYETTKKIATEMEVGADVAYVTDVEKMAGLGVMASPVLVIDGQPVLSGAGHSEEEVKNAIRAHADNQAEAEGDGSCGCCCC